MKSGIYPDFVGNKSKLHYDFLRLAHAGRLTSIAHNLAGACQNSRNGRGAANGRSAPSDCVNIGKRGCGD
jgi:hypothetical protein